MSHYRVTDTVLDKILARKVEEISDSQVEISLVEIRRIAETIPQPADFISALRRDTVALIAEVKKASPSKGVMVENFNHRQIAQTYAGNGAACISVLTDEDFFQGHLSYLQEVNQVVSVPTLRKDFIIDPYQVYEARAAGADAVLLIVAALDDSQLADLHTLIMDLGMAALVEVHNEGELERAMRINPLLLGINNRDLKTFMVDLTTTERLAKRVPDDVTLVAESGLKTTADVARMGAMGAHAVLIGEGLVTSNNIADTVRQFSIQKRG